MRKCPKCGKSYDDTWKVCLSDSTPLVDTASGGAEINNTIHLPRDSKKETIENMGGFIVKITTFFSVIVLPLNLFAGIVGGGWLLFLGEWRLVVAGFLFSITFPMAYSFTMGLIGMPITLLLNHLYAKRKIKMALFIGTINIILTNVVHLALVIITILIALLARDGKFMLPFLIFGYSVITEPFRSMAAAEPPDAYASWLSIVFLQLNYILLAITVPFGFGIIGLLLSIALMSYIVTFLIKIAIFEIKQESL